MTYPPPPGVPGDPGQQPMPDPYAPGGGYAPPPQDPYGAPPPQDPYGAPPPVDPYGTPPQDPYGSPPMSGVPMSPGAPGMAPDPYGQPPMGGMPGQQPSFLGAPPPQKNNNLGVILGIAGGALVVIILAVVVIVMVNSGGSDDRAGGGDGKSDGASESGDSSASDDGGDSGGSGTYAVTQGMCEKVDVSGVPSSLGLSKLDDLTLDDEMYCSSMGDTLVSIKGKAYGDASEAEAGYEEYKESETVGGDGLQEFTGDWDKGEISQYANLEGTASVFIQDGNMVITMYISNTDSVSNAEAKDAASALAGGVFKAASS